MRVNSKTLSIPPYISTHWQNVSSLRMDKDGSLNIYLTDRTHVKIPGLPGSDIEQIFNAHAEYLENPQSTEASDPLSALSKFGIGSPGLSHGGGLENFTGMMQHDASQSDAPDMPKEVLDKISGVSKALGIDTGAFNLPEDQPHCNCPYCQISRAMAGKIADTKESGETLEEEPVSDAELKFREWDVETIGDKLYKVSNPFDHDEYYQVYLDNPVGCTCGEHNCQHIIAVLDS